MTNNKITTTLVTFIALASCDSDNQPPPGKSSENEEAIPLIASSPSTEAPAVVESAKERHATMPNPFTSVAPTIPPSSTSTSTHNPTPTPTSTPVAVPILRHVVSESIDVEMPAAYEEFVGTQCESTSNFMLSDDGDLYYRERGKIRNCTGESWDFNQSIRNAKWWWADQIGNIYLTGSRTDHTTRISEISVTKLDPKGNVLWNKSTPTGTTMASPTFIRASLGGVIVGGNADGQLPGNPPEADGQPWILRYDDDGELEWLRQMRKGLQGEHINDFGGQSVALDGSDNLYVTQSLRLDDMVIHKINRQGEVVWTSSLGQRHCQGQLHVAADGSFLVHGGITMGQPCITRLDDKGQLVWIKTYEIHHSTIMDPIEGTTWSGRNTGDVSVALDEDAIILVGQYSNAYTHGSQRPPNFDSAWVLKLDDDGSVDSKRNIRVGPLTVRPSESGSSVSFTPTASRVLPDGGLRLVGQQSDRGRSMTVLVTLPGIAAPTAATASTAVDSPVPPTSPTASASRSVLSSLWNRLTHW